MPITATYDDQTRHLSDGSPDMTNSPAMPLICLVVANDDNPYQHCQSTLTRIMMAVSKGLKSPHNPLIEMYVMIIKSFASGFCAGSHCQWAAEQLTVGVYNTPNGHGSA